MALDLVVEKLDAVPEAVRSMYVEKDGKFHLDVTGLPDVSGLQSALQKERDAAKAANKALKETADKYKDIDPDSYHRIMSKFQGDEEAQLLASGNVDEVIKRRTAIRDADWQKKLDAAAAERDAEKQKTSKFLSRVLDEQIRAAVHGKVHDKAVEDALFRARMMFSLDDEGNAVCLQNGEPVLGKDGKTPFRPQEWIETMRDTAPHWFPSTASGSGAQQNHSKGGANLMNLPPIERMNAARAGKK